MADSRAFHPHRDQLLAHRNDVATCVCEACSHARDEMKAAGWRFCPLGWNLGVVWDREPEEGHCHGHRCHHIGGPCYCRCHRCSTEDDG